MTLYEKLLLLTYYNPRIKLTKSRGLVSAGQYGISVRKNYNSYIFIDSMNILTRKDFNRLIKCL